MCSTATSYLDVEPDDVRAIDDGVRAHHAAQGNIEYALSTADDARGCGCYYPDYLADTVVADSDAVVAELRVTAVTLDGLAWLAELPRYLALGRYAPSRDRPRDPENLAGWSLSLAAIEPQHPQIHKRTSLTGTSTPAPRVVDWLRRGKVEVLCCIHTGPPYAQDYPHSDGHRDRRGLVVNNGCAGLPNFTRASPRSPAETPLVRRWRLTPRTCLNGY